MTEQYLRNATADAISGAVSACEGIRNSICLLNGPLGCKFYYGFGGVHSLPRRRDLWGLRGDLRLADGMDDRLLRSQYFTGGPQTPGTNLRYSDYIFGTRDQLFRALNDILSERKYDLVTVIQTPGTSLLGEAPEDELQKLADEYGTPCLFIENTMLSGNSLAGYDEATVRLLKLLAVKTERPRRERPVVNIFGFDAQEKYPEGGMAEIRRLLSLAGIDTGAVVGLDCPMEAFRAIPSADANVILCPERCRATAAYLRAGFDTPVFETGGMPIGFDLTERFIRGISGILGTDCTPAIEEIERGRARAFYAIARWMGGAGFPKDLRYAAEGECSLLLGYVDFLSGYLGIKPKAVHPLYRSCGGEEQLRSALARYHSEEALQTDIAEADHVLLLASANTIVAANLRHAAVFGIETAGPSSGYIDVVPKTHIGVTGALYLLEQILNGTRLLNAWK